MFTNQGTAPSKPEINIKILDDTAKARRRRALYKERKERKREAYFVREYVQLKHPQIYQEIKESYKQFVERYPSRSDFTKTYFFRKWQKQLGKEKSNLYLPHLPILTSKRQLTTKEKTTSSSPQQPQSSPQQPQSSPQQPQSSPQQPQSSPQQPQSSPQQPQSTPQQPQSSSQQPQSSPQHPQPSPQIIPMSLGDMEIAAEEIIRSLQSDRDLMDIIENFEFPEPLWNTDYEIPDYTLETELEW